MKVRRTRSKSCVTASVSWGYYNDPRFDRINDQYLPDSGEGGSKATQAVTAVNKLVYRWYNDGDVYDNRYGLGGWGNDLSSYANWLHRYTPAKNILERIYKIYSESQYEDLLQEVADLILDEEMLAEWADTPTVGSIYECNGPFEFMEYDEDEYDDEWEDEFDDYDDEYDE